VNRGRALLPWLFIAGCAAERPSERAATHPARAEPTKAAASSPPPAGDAADSAVQAALAEVVGVRKLGTLRPVSSRVIARKELGERVRDEVLSELEPRQVQGITESLVAFGSVPVDIDYQKAVLELLGSQVAGYYDPRDKMMFLLDDLGEEAQAATLWHELVHAIQDQHYDLRPKLKWAPGKGDTTAAVQALAEGDATSAMLDVMLSAQGQTALDLSEQTFAQGIGMLEALPEIATVPAIMKRSIVAPYTDGIAFVHALRRAGGWAAVDAAWREPPTTTEQILHPEKYAVREGAAKVASPSPPPGGPTEAIYVDRLGEQGLRLLFEDWMPVASAGAAATGWAGDEVVVFATGDRLAVAVHVAFDDEAHAKRAAEAFARGALLDEPEDRGSAAARISSEQAASALRSGRACKERSRRGPFAIVRRGHDLGVALGPFRRQGGAVATVADCRAGLGWAAAIAAGK